MGDPASRVISANGPLLVRCANGEELRADSAVIYQASNEVQLFRRVDYQDPTRSLTSDQATYNSQTGRLYATGNVVFVDKQKGSTLRGPELEYYRAMAGRPESQMTATQRPHVTVRPRNSGSTSGANASRRRDPMEIDADRVTSVGDRLLTAIGNVVINDNGTRSTAEEAFYDQAAEHVELRRNAHVDNEKYKLQGELIVSDLKDGSVSKVVAQTNARLVSERLTVNGPQLQLFFERDLLQRMVSGQVPGAAPPRDTARAVAAPDSAARTQPARPAAAPPAAPPAAAPGRPPVVIGRAPGDTSTTNPTRPVQVGDSAARAERPPLPPGFRSVAVAKGFRMEADSLEAILPEQRLRRVNAVGSARGESWDTVVVRTVRADSGGAAGVAPRPLTEPPTALHEKDILTADTIIAFFRDSTAAADSARRAAQPRDSVRLAGRPATPPPAPSDTTNTELERLLAIGNAHSLYRMRNDSTRPDQRQGINYLIGDRIDLTFKASEVELAHVMGLKQGMYLDPDNNPPADSAAADTSAAGRRAAAGARGAAGRPAAQPATRPGAAPATRPTSPPPAPAPAPAPPPPPSQPRPERPLPRASAPARASAPLASRAAPSPGGRT
ncbi:MAG: OstA-like protein [Longimicrobiaceae bacterium]